MSNRIGSLLPALKVVALAVVLSVPLRAAAQPMWDQQKGNCEAMFQGFEQVDVRELTSCLGLWESYRDVSKLNEAQKQFMGKVFNRVYQEGDRQGQYLARNALARLGFTPQEKVAAASGPGEEGKAARLRKDRKTGVHMHGRAERKRLGRHQEDRNSKDEREQHRECPPIPGQ